MLFAQEGGEKMSWIRNLITAFAVTAAVAGCGQPVNPNLEQRVQQPVVQAPVKQEQPEKYNEPSDLQNMVISYMVDWDKTFTSKDFARQALGVNAELKVYNLTRHTVTFDVPKKIYGPNTLGKLTKQPNEKRVKVVSESNSDYSIEFPAEDLNVSPKRKLVYNFKDGIKYDITLKELSDYISNKSVYCGDLNFIVGNKVASNHGPLVSKKGEPSMTRLANRIIKKSNAQTNEEKAQALLDFVLKNTKWVENAGRDSEVLKRAPELLMTKKDDCSGKTILYASLLEQTGINYLMVYAGDPKRNSVDHVTVAVEGEFSAENGLGFEFKKKRYHIAEPSTEVGYEIGKSVLEGFSLDNLKYYQKPGKNARVYRFDGEPVEFLGD